MTLDSLPGAGVRVFRPAREPRIVLGRHDVAQPDVDDLGRGIPSAELLAHLLAHQLGERVGRFRPLDLLGDGELGGWGRVQRDPEDGLGGGEHDIGDPRNAGGFQDVIGFNEDKLRYDRVSLRGR